MKNYRSKTGNYWFYKGYIVEIVQIKTNSTVLIYRDNDKNEFVDSFDTKIGEEYSKAKQMIESKKYNQ